MAKAVLFLLVLINAFCIAAASAQTPAAEAARQADVLQRQNEERIRRDIEEALPQRTAPAVTPAVPAPGIDASAIGPACHQVREIVINGAPNLSASVRSDIVSRYAGRCLGLSDIEQILTEITKDYISRGYITTRAYLPSQDLSKGRLEILVVEGVVGTIELQDGGKRSIRPGLVFPSEGDLLNLRDFEQGIEQLNRLASNNAQLDIQPGDVPGASRVLILNEPGFPLHASIGADNYGSESTGRNQLALSLVADRLLGLNELMVYAHRRSQPYDAERKASAADSFSFILPLGYSTLSASAARSRYSTSVIAPSGLPLRFHGDSDSLNLKLNRVAYRGPAGRVMLGAGLTGKSTNNFLEGELLGVSSRRLTLLDLEASASTRAAGGALTALLDYVRGLSMFGALHDPDGLPADAPRAQFGKLHYEFSWLRPFRAGVIDAEFSTQVVGQRAQDALYGSEQVLIGGIYSVRGFSRNTLSGDNGWYARNEIALRNTLSLAGQPLPLRLYAGLDLGAVSNRAAGNPGGRLKGIALGISGAYRHFSFDLFHARPLSQPDFLPHEGGQTWLRLNISI
jgi:hemolysin activation/secretion protein